MKRYKKITRTPGEWVLDIVKVVFLAFVVVVTVYPFWNIFIISINDATDAIRGGLYFLPRKLSLSSYAEILGTRPPPKYIVNTNSRFQNFLPTRSFLERG